jgi:branched-chain amino acid transport system substrate-binding protein
LDSKALTKIQSAALITIIIVAAVAGSLAYTLWSRPAQSTENIRIGVCADLDNIAGKDTWRGAVLAAEQINAEGGVLGRNLTVVGEDDDSGSSMDIAVGINALTKLITVDKADFIISSGGVNLLAYQDVCCEHKKIFLSFSPGIDDYSQRVLDNYEKYKYSFRTDILNDTMISKRMLGEVMAVANYTGFTKVALLFDDFPMGRAIASGLNESLPEHGLEVVYNVLYPLQATDFTSYFAAIEASGAEILVPFIVVGGDISFVKEWYDRQSPFVVWGAFGLAGTPDGWELTEGKCDTVSCVGLPAVAGYPLTNKTVPAREAYIQRWGEVPNGYAFSAYDTLRFILSDAIKRAGTTETEAVIKTLETTNVETTSARHFFFTSSHDVYASDNPNNPAEDNLDYFLMCYFQWQNGTQVPMHPEEIKKEAGATYKYPPWHGPWSNKQTP